MILTTNDFKKELVEVIKEELSKKNEALLSRDVRKLFVEFISKTGAYDKAGQIQLYTPSGNKFFKKSGIVLSKASYWLGLCLDERPPFDEHIQKSVHVYNLEGEKLSNINLSNNSLYAFSEDHFKEYVEKRLSEKPILFKGDFFLVGENIGIEDFLDKLIKEKVIAKDQNFFRIKTAIYRFNIDF